MRKIIAFGHKSKSGKDTYGEELKKQLTELGHKVEIVKFAGGIKDIIVNMTTCERKDLESQDFKASYCPIYDLTYRDLCKAVGQGFRAVDPLYWVKDVNKYMNKKDTIYILTDLRFNNEIDYVHEEGGLAFGLKPQYFGYVDSGCTSPSEIELDGSKKYDKVFKNKHLKSIPVHCKEIIKLLKL